MFSNETMPDEVIEPIAEEASKDDTESTADLEISDYETSEAAESEGISSQQTKDDIFDVLAEPDSEGSNSTADDDLPAQEDKTDEKPKPVRKSTRAKKEEKVAESEPEESASKPKAKSKTASKAASKKSSETVSEESEKSLKDQFKDEKIERLLKERKMTDRLAENQTFYAGISAIDNARRVGKILEGVVGAIETVTYTDAYGGKRNHVILSVMLENRFKVMIPFDEFFRDKPIAVDEDSITTEKDRRTYEQRQRQMSGKLYGARVHFVITNVTMNSMTDYAITASRKIALEKLERFNFGGAEKGESRFKVGDICDGDIISVGAKGMVVNIAGVDTRMTAATATFRMVNSMGEYYHVGEKIRVKIREIRTNDKGRISLVVSGKDIEMENAKDRQRSGLLKVGTLTTGIITSIRPSINSPGKIVINAYLQYFDMPAIVRAIDPRLVGVPLKAGDSLRLSVNGFSEDGLVLTNCKGVDNTALYIYR